MQILWKRLKELIRDSFTGAPPQILGRSGATKALLNYTGYVKEAGKK